MELSKEFVEQDNNAPDDVVDDDNYFISDLCFEEVDENDYDLCSGCDEKPIPHLFQPCGYIICTNCIKKTNSVMWMSNIQLHND